MEMLALWDVGSVRVMAMWGCLLYGGVGDVRVLLMGILDLWDLGSVGMMTMWGCC